MATAEAGRSGAAGVATLVVEKGAALLLVVGLARTLDPVAYGLYSGMVAFLTLLQIVADAGLESVLLRRLSTGPDDRVALLRAGLGLRLALTFGAVAIAVALTPWVVGPEAAGPATVVAALALLLNAQPVFRAALRADLAMDQVLRAAVVASVVTVVAAGGAALAGASLGPVFAGVLLGNVTGLVVAGLALRPRFGGGPSVAPAIWRELLGESWPVGANLLVAMVPLRAAPLFLMQFDGPVAVGHYASAARLTEALNLLADGVMLAALPILSRLAATDPARLVSLAEMLARLLAVAFTSVALVVSPLGEGVMTLVFGESFVPAGRVLAVLVFVQIFFAQGTLYSGLLVAVERPQVMFALGCVSLVPQVTLVGFLVWKWGAIGAAAGLFLGAAVNQSLLAFLPATAEWIWPCLKRSMVPIAIGFVVSELAAVVVTDPFARGAVALTAFWLVLLATGQVRTTDGGELAELWARR